METSRQLRMYDVLSIRTPTAKVTPGAQGGARQRANEPDLVLRYFAWLNAAEIGPREREWAKHARGRLA